eukprot:scaffold4934_cov128-Isochrysis_galbana.AAC.8
MARSCFVRASCASASARSANLLRVHLQTKLGSKVDYCLGGSLCRGGKEDADGLVLAGGGGEGEYKGPAHAAEGAALGGEFSFSGGEGAVDDVFEVSVYVPWREEGGGATGSGVFPDVRVHVGVWELGGSRAFVSIAPPLAPFFVLTQPALYPCQNIWPSA